VIGHVKGDLLASPEQYIAHGCNTQGVMGAGIAALIAERYPEVERSYRVACRAKDFRIGTCQDVYLPEDQRTVFNLGTQVFPGRNATYWAVMLSFGNLFEFCRTMNIDRVGIPRIGCGIGGLDWPTTEHVINGIYEWVPDGPEVVVYTL
jgi:O-acetyl-ADP-ribose deacetylase (regulator of RNase III)